MEKQCKYECSICLLSIKRNARVLRCGHKFHKNCYLEWRERSEECPICRKTNVHKYKNSDKLHDSIIDYCIGNEMLEENSTSIPLTIENMEKLVRSIEILLEEVKVGSSQEETIERYSKRLLELS